MRGQGSALLRQSIGQLRSDDPQPLLSLLRQGHSLCLPSHKLFDSHAVHEFCTKVCLRWPQEHSEAASGVRRQRSFAMPPGSCSDELQEANSKPCPARLGQPRACLPAESRIGYADSAYSACCS